MNHKRKRQSSDTGDALIGTVIDFDAREEVDDITSARGGSSQVLPVCGGLPEDFQGEPEDGSQYLYLVRIEAAKQPSVVRTDNPYPTPPPSASDIVISANQVEISRRPSIHWKNAFVAHFESMRLAYENAGAPPLLEEEYYPLPPSNDEPAWRSYIFGKKSKTMDTPSDISSGKSTFRSQRKPASTTLVKHLPLTMLLPLLMEFHDSLATRLHSPPSTMLVPRRMKGQQSATKSALPPLLPEFDAQWFMALLVAVDSLQPFEEVSNLRALAKTCLLVTKELDRAPNSDTRQEQLASCWMIVVAVATTWHQSDLWDAI